MGTKRSAGASALTAGRTRTQVAETIATRAIVHTRKAQAQGCVNVITRLAIEEHATALNIPGDTFSVRTVARIVQNRCRLMGEMQLLGEELR